MGMESFCVLPWVHLATHPQGQVSLCCRVDYEGGKGMARNGSTHLNLNSSSITDIMNSETHRHSRLQMLKGERPPACKGCYHDEDQGVESKRQRENNIFRSFDVARARERTDSEGNIIPDLHFLELRLG